MKNRFEVHGDTARVFIRLKDGTEKFTTVDVDSLELMASTPWKRSTMGYVENWKGVQLHRLLAGAPDGLVVDHINLDKLDNRKANLRVVTQLVNSNNRVDASNVYFQKSIGRWRVRFYYNWKSHGFGCYGTKEEAVQVASEIRSKLLRGEPIEGCHYKGRRYS